MTQTFQLQTVQRLVSRVKRNITSLAVVISICGDFFIMLKERLKEISIPVYLLVIFFASASWIDLNGLLVELPLMVWELPEGWALPSYMTIIISISNIGPVVYVIANRCAPEKVKEWPVIYVIISIGALSCVLLAFFWKQTTMVGGSEHSTALLTLVMFLALVDSTSSVVFIPYMAVFKTQYLTAYFIGEGCSGLIPGIVSLIQGIGSDPDCQNISTTFHNTTTGLNYTEHIILPFHDPPRFSVDTFFYFLFAMLILSAICFTVLNYAHFVRKEWVELINTKPRDENEASLRHFLTRDEDGIVLTRKKLTCGQYTYLLMTMAWVCALMYGMFPSIVSYSTLPYGYRAFSLATRLSVITSPMACLLALFLPTSSLVIIGIVTFIGTLCSSHQLYLAFMSPFPLWQDSPLGESMTVLSAILLMGLFSYVRVVVAAILKKEGRKALLWCGAVSQAGALVGSVILFVMVVVLKLFKDMPPCGFR